MREPIPFGRYRLLRRLAVGGMAEVWLAEAAGDPGRRLAVKRLLPTLADDPTFVTMFLDEARIGALLTHPGIVPVHDLGREGASYFLAMDYVPGQDLRALLARLRSAGATMPPAFAAFVAARAAEALDHAHRAAGPSGRALAVVHRDLSPANVLIGFDGRVRVIDFGIAQAAFRARRERAVLRGKFGYLSPEQAGGREVDRRADVFSLGAVLHECLTGHRLFAGPNDLAILHRVLTAEIAAPSLRNPAVPPGLDAVVLRALSRAPDGRWPWAADLAEALGPFEGGTTAAVLGAALRGWFPEAVEGGAAADLPGGA